ncbi:hypothetical protein GCM10020221_20440 [Streptomyces thioluteus]|uniref:Uncharacterized protein n=1 Tax=Streptomyces thioluteus TaxID=66431 RepID=A0ABN3WQK1_STRTU
MAASPSGRNGRNGGPPGEMKVRPPPPVSYRAAMSTATTIRTIDGTELGDWFLGVRTGFHISTPATKEEIEGRRGGIDFSRTQGAFDAAAAWAPSAASPSSSRCRRRGGPGERGHQRDRLGDAPPARPAQPMMERDLRAAKERGDTGATLLAAEYPIYGRFGFGPAAPIAVWEVDTARTGLDRRRSTPDDGGRLDFVDGATVRALAPALHERVRATRHGVVDRDERWWRFATGDLARPDWTEPFHVLHRRAGRHRRRAPHLHRRRDLVRQAPAEHGDRARPHRGHPRRGTRPVALPVDVRLGS